MRKGFETLEDKKGNKISVPSYKVDRLSKAGWRKPGKHVAAPKPETKTGSE